MMMLSCLACLVWFKDGAAAPRNRCTITDCCIALGDQSKIGFEKMYADLGLKVSIKGLVVKCNVMSSAQVGGGE